MISFVVIIVAIIAIVLAVLNANGAFIPIPEKTLLTLNKDGSIVYDDVTVLSDEYDVGSLRDFATEQVNTYNESALEKVNLKLVKSDGNKAFVRTEYPSALSYSSFTGYDAFFGTVDQARSGGRAYSFEMPFVDASTMAPVEWETVEANGADKVFIIRANTTVSVPGTIVYVTSEGTNVSGNEVSIRSADGNPDAAPLCYIIFKEEQ